MPIARTYIHTPYMIDAQMEGGLRRRKAARDCFSRGPRYMIYSNDQRRLAYTAPSTAATHYFLGASFGVDSDGGCSGLDLLLEMKVLFLAVVRGARCRGAGTRLPFMNAI